MNSVRLYELLISAYDPTKNRVVFSGVRVTGASADRLYRRISATEHELHLQVTSPFLQQIQVGSHGLLEMEINAGGAAGVLVSVGNVTVSDIYVEELGSEVPVIVVVLKNIK